MAWAAHGQRSPCFGEQERQAEDSLTPRVTGDVRQPVRAAVPGRSRSPSQSSHSPSEGVPLLQWVSVWGPWGPSHASPCGSLREARDISPGGGCALPNRGTSPPKPDPTEALGPQPPPDRTTHAHAAGSFGARVWPTPGPRAAPGADAHPSESDTESSRRNLGH